MRKKMVSGHRGSSLEWELLIHRAASEMQLSTEDETEKKKRKKSCTGRNKCWIIYTNQNIHSNLVSLGLNQLKEASWKTQPTPITEGTLSLSCPHGSKAVNGDMWTKVQTCMHVFSEALWPWCESGQMCWQDLCSWPKQQHRACKDHCTGSGSKNVEKLL